MTVAGWIIGLASFASAGVLAERGHHVHCVAALAAGWYCLLSVSGVSA